MKILTVVCNLSLGGTQRAAQNFARAYKSLGHEGRVLAVYGGGVRSTPLRDSGVAVWESFDALCADADDWTPDIVHFHSHGLGDGIRDEIVSRYSRAKCIETNVFSSPTNIESSLEYSFQLSNWCAFRYLAQGGSRAKCRVLGNPIDTAGFFKERAEITSAFKERCRIPKRSLVVGRVGQPGTFNWSCYLIDVFRSLVLRHGLDLHLLLCGPPKRIRERLMKDASLAGKFTIIDKIEADAELRACYSAMDLFLHIADVGDTFGMVIAESLLCETPVISLRTPWEANSQGEVIGGALGGEIVSTIPEFEAQTMKYLLDHDLRISKGRSGRAHILDAFSEVSIADRALRMVDGEDIGAFQLCEIFRDAGPSLLAKGLVWIVYKINSVRVRNYVGAMIRTVYRYSFLESGKYEQEKELLR